MDLKRLEEITATPWTATNQDLDDLLDLAQQYPYAQHLRILISKVAQHVHDLEQVNKLNTAAIYSADRNVLKKVITDPDYTIYLPLPILDVRNNALTSYRAKGKKDKPAPPPTPEVEPVNERASVKDPEEGADKTQSGGIFGEVMKNLDKLRSLRKKYSFLEKKDAATEETYSKPGDAELRSTEMEESASPMPTSEDMEKPGAPGAVKPDQEKVAEEMAEEPPAESPTPAAESKKPSTEKKPARDTRYQQELIDRFISKRPSIPKPTDIAKDEEAAPVDLALEAQALEGNVVSETLAGIFVKQGKLEKARDIYKKLIWKYPQKKAYFAARIEDLKG